MLGWFFKKGTDKKIQELHSTIKSSFTNFREDMNQVSQWITHFKTKHDSHEKKFEELIERIEILEEQIGIREKESLNPEHSLEGFSIALDPDAVPSFAQWDELTDTHKKICWYLSKLRKESPSGWISFKTLATEMYPSKEYHKIRSAVSQFISALEVHGFVERKRFGKEAYIRLCEGFEKRIPKKKVTASINS